MRDVAMTDVALAEERSRTEPSFAEDVRRGLGRAGQKHLSPKYLYDALGSALFEAITQLPEYGLWRAERRILLRHGAAIATACDSGVVVELGSGSANKTALLLDALLARRSVEYYAIDISASALTTTRHTLAGLSGAGVHTIEADYYDGVPRALASRHSKDRALVLLLGSSLGNFDTDESIRLLRQVRAALAPGDRMLLGNDLRKPESLLLAAYDDPLGVTAAFNRNVLARINRELDADFDLDAFRHRARYRTDTHNVEMHLECMSDQVMRMPGVSVAFRAGETIHTESSHKYTIDEIDGLAERCGFRPAARWLDDEWAFASSLWEAR